MFLKTVVKYKLIEFRKAMLVFYAALIGITILLFSITMSSASSTASFNGIEVSGIIFLFIASANSFKESFHMLLQNGISRKTMFLAQIIWILCVSIIMALVDRILIITVTLGSQLSSRFMAGGLFDQIFIHKYKYDPSSFLLHFKVTIFSFCLYTGFAALGYFVTLLYYRMSKALKIAVSVSVPCFIFIVLPIIDLITAGKVTYFISWVSKLIFGVNGSNGPISVMAVSLFGFALFSGLSWLLIRKAVVKK